MIHAHLHLLRAIQATIADLEKLIKQLIAVHPRAQLLAALPGVGQINLAQLLAEVGPIQTSTVRCGLPEDARRRAECESGRATGGDSDIQRGRPNPDGRLFGQATTRTHRRAYANRHTRRRRSDANAHADRQATANPNGQIDTSDRPDEHLCPHRGPSEEEIFAQGLTER